ncbi:MAG: GNAT family N-acetyltransferase [Reyranellaceae bacterium]
MNDPRRIETARLSLRPIGEDDFAELCTLMADPEVGGQLQHGTLDVAATRRMLDEYVAIWRDKGYGMFALRRRTDGRFVGISGLWDHHDGIGVASRVAIARWAKGEGYAPEAGIAVIRFAFETLGLDTVWAVTRESNPDAQRALAKMGWTLRLRYEANGKSLLRFNMTREQWSAGEKKT